MPRRKEELLKQRRELKITGNKTSPREEDEESNKSIGSSSDMSSFVMLSDVKDEDEADSVASDWSLLDDFCQKASIRKKMKMTPHISNQEPADVLTSRLLAYLNDCVRTLNLEGVPNAGLQVLPERDLKSLVVKFLHGTTYDTTCGEGEAPEIKLGYKCSSSSEATWDAIRWHGFCTERKPVAQFPTVSVAKDLNVAYSNYCQYSLKQHYNSLGPIMETNVEFSGRFGNHFMNNYDRKFRRNFPERCLSSNVSGWIVATVLIIDPFTGRLPVVPNRYVPIIGSKDRLSGLVSLFEFPRQVLPLVRFDASFDDILVIQQIWQGLTSIFSSFFEQKVDNL